MNKTEFVNAVYEKNMNDIQSRAAAGRIVDNALDIIANELEKRGSVSIPGFGVFSVTERKATTGRNPQTGEVIDIPAHGAVKFAPSGKMRESVR